MKAGHRFAHGLQKKRQSYQLRDGTLRMMYIRRQATKPGNFTIGLENTFENRDEMDRLQYMYKTVF